MLKSLRLRRSRNSMVIAKYLLLVFSAAVAADSINPATTMAVAAATTTMAVKNSDSDQPVIINSDYAEFDDKNGLATYTSNVVTDQGSRHLTADTLVIQRGADNEISLITATGAPAEFKAQPDLNKAMTYGKAKTIKYYPDEDKALFIENAELIQNDNIIKGQLLTYYFNTGLLISQSTQASRTTVILQPKNDD